MATTHQMQGLSREHRYNWSPSRSRLTPLAPPFLTVVEVKVAEKNLAWRLAFNSTASRPASVVRSVPGVVGWAVPGG